MISGFFTSLPWAVFLWATPPAIYLDAVSNNIGRQKTEKRGWLKEWSALEWALCGIALGPVGLCIYLSRRHYLIERAEKYPVYVDLRKRFLISIILFVVGLPLLTTYRA